MTPRLESLAAYIAALIVMNELSSEAGVRVELSQAIEAFQAARKKRQAA
jgi:hypothetical protein